MKVNEAGCNYQAFGINGCCSVKDARSNGCDMTALDSDATDSIEAGGGVHDATVHDNCVELLCAGRQREKKQT